MTLPSNRIEQISAEVDQWLNDVVIGLNLCPFAAKPQRNQQIKIFVSQASDEQSLLEEMLQQLLELEQSQPEQLETTLVVVPDMLSDFDHYNQFIDWAEALIDQNGWQGTFQLATFHPNYCFYGAAPEDAENLTNRSPYPIFHLIREESMEKVLQHYPNPEAIPDNNIARVSALTESERCQLFPYLFGAKK
ncbi:DUF1415 domain-containing protein [Vibrio sp.]|uniref:DUF1415 domain-containing protein n=1 Tax=Vibrio sp. TaxID=678 RepID=UPI003D136EB6